MISFLEEKVSEKLRPPSSLDKKKYLDTSFATQCLFVEDAARFLAAQCSRRAGKSNGLAIRFFNTLEQHPGALCLYIALTRESARNIMWGVLQELDAKFKIGCEFTESNLSMTHPNGARLQLFGADMKNFIRRLKGIKTPGVGIDEAQDFGPHLQSLVDDVITPALTDYTDSWLAITGTPGPVPLGYFYDVTSSPDHSGFVLHKWTLLENPYLPQAPSFIEDLKRKRGWDEQNPTLRREWRNEWVLDLESLLIRYNESLCHYESLPPTSWTYALGIDIGFNDADALALLAWSDSSPNTYLVDEVIAHKQGLTELVAQIEHFQKHYPISKIIMDEGGLGKKLAEEIRRRHHIPVQPADKARKMETVEFLNDHLRLGRFKAKRSSRFAEDSYRVQIDREASTPDRIKVKDGFHSDIIDAVLYAWKESPAFTYIAPKKKPAYKSDEWAHEQVTEMEQNAEEFFQKQEEAAEGYGDY